MHLFIVSFHQNPCGISSSQIRDSVSLIYAHSNTLLSLAQSHTSSNESIKKHSNTVLSYILKLVKKKYKT